MDTSSQIGGCSGAVSRRRDSVATHGEASRPALSGENRSFGSRFVGTT